MSKAEFLETLKNKLTGEISPVQVRENVDYYNQYILDKTGAGMSEQDVIQMLGDPLLIARTIIDTQGGTNGYQESTASSAQSNTQEEKPQAGIRGWKSWQVIVVIVLVLIVLFSVLRVLLPILMPLIIIGLLVSYFAKRRR